MQVDRQPSPWPCVVMLAGLLLLCLMAPRNWQNTVGVEDPAIGAASDIAFDDLEGGHYLATDGDRPANPNLTVGLFDFSGINIGRLADESKSDLLNLCVPPPIDELIATHAAMTQLSAHFGRPGGDGFDWPMLVRAAMKATSDVSPSGPALTDGDRPTREFAAPFEFFGELVSKYSSVGEMVELVAQISDGVPGWVLSCGERFDSFLAGLQAAGFDKLTTSQAASPVSEGPSMVRVIGPDDRLAMLPAPREVDATHPWCVPQTLLEELDRLSGQRETAQWASQVRNQLHSLTDREQLEGDDVQIILADLSGAAQEAASMAERFDNDRLRVELLRAHWGLARRLDCWGAMHEKRMASRFQSRVAARGSLNPYLGGSSDSATVSTEATALSKDIETYETNRDPKLGQRIALQRQSLKKSSDAIDRSVADSVEQHYRNANLRVAITAEMLNRLAGVERNDSQPVNTEIAGTYVQGQSYVHSESHVLLDPSVDEWQLELKADGVVTSNTLANGGPARFHSQGMTGFSASKEIVVNDKGIHLKQSNVNTTSSNRLVGVTTDYDWVPFFGGYSWERAVNEYHSRQGQAKLLMESRVAAEASETLDQQTREAVDQIRQRTYDRFASELDAFDIKLTPIEMTTTTDRLVARVRVAGDKQLGSHTPRPRALSDSLASAQIHETALTNMAMTLGLDGKRYTGPELREVMHEKFPQLAAKSATEIRQETVFQFAAENAVQVHVNDGKFELTISFASVELQQDVMPNVTVHAYYTPKVDGLNAELVREGTLGIEGRFGSGDRARLHNVFNRVLPPERHLPIVQVDNPNDKRFQGLMITQLVLEDGWIGLAVGPATDARVAERSRSLR
jgi:hypothetical protein